jgi:MFS family permease
MYFLGWTLSALTLTRLADKTGRLPVFISGLALNVFAATGMIWSNSIWLTGFCLFLNGVTMTSRWSIGYVQLLEFVDPDTLPILGSLVQGANGLLMVYGAFVSMTFGNTVWIPVTLLVVNVIGLVATLGFKVLPESPKYLFSRGEYDKCREVLCRIALTNNHKGNGI